MVQPVAAPQIVAFLEYMNQNHPEIKGLWGLEKIWTYLEYYEESQDRYLDKRYWSDFVQRMRRREPLILQEFGAERLQKSIDPAFKDRLIKFLRLRDNNRFSDPLSRYNSITNRVMFFL